jgi:uncharacterized protein
MPECGQILAESLCGAPWVTGPNLVVLFCGLLIAAFARGYTGFAFSALLVASWSLVAPPSLPVAVAVLLEVSASILQAASVWRQVAWRRVGLLLAGAVIGTPFGVALLSVADAGVLRTLIALLLLICCFALLAGWVLKRTVGAIGQAGVGAISGLVNGATAMGGMPVALFLAASSVSPATMRASFIAYFFALDILAASLMARQGILGVQTLAVAVICLPGLALGLWLGGRHFLSASEAQFRRQTLWLLILLAAVGLARAAIGE